MSVETSYSEPRQHLVALLDRAVDDRETIITSRNGARPPTRVGCWRPA
jgi:hypothetical protein